MLLSVVEGEVLGRFQPGTPPSLSLLFPPGGFVFSPLHQHLDVFPRLLDDPHSLLHGLRPDVVDGEHSVILSDGYNVLSFKYFFYFSSHLSPYFSDAPPGTTRATKTPVSASSYLSRPRYIKDNPKPLEFRLM